MSIDLGDLGERLGPPRPRTLIKSTDEPPTSGHCPGCGELIFYPGWLCFTCRRICIPPQETEDDEPDGEGDELDRGEVDDAVADEWDFDWDYWDWG